MQSKIQISKTMYRCDAKILELFHVIRIESNRNYIFAVIQLAKDFYATVSSIYGTNWTISCIGKVDETKIMAQSKEQYINDHAVIHISASRYKYIENWR